MATATDRLLDLARRCVAAANHCNGEHHYGYVDLDCRTRHAGGVALRTARIGRWKGESTESEEDALEDLLRAIEEVSP
jgi:hypothetical protein